MARRNSAAAPGTSARQWALVESEMGLGGPLAAGREGPAAVVTLMTGWPSGPGAQWRNSRQMRDQAGRVWLRCVFITTIIRRGDVGGDDLASPSFGHDRERRGQMMAQLRRAPAGSRRVQWRSVRTAPCCVRCHPSVFAAPPPPSSPVARPKSKQNGAGASRRDAWWKLHKLGQARVYATEPSVTWRRARRESKVSGRARGAGEAAARIMAGGKWTAPLVPFHSLDQVRDASVAPASFVSSPAPPAAAPQRPRSAPSPTSVGAELARGSR